MIERITLASIPSVIYIPDPFRGKGPLPLVVLFRATPDEWFNAREDDSRGRRTIYTIVADMIEKSLLRPAAFVFPSTCCNAEGEFYFTEDVHRPDLRKSRIPFLNARKFEEEYLPELQSRFPQVDTSRVSLDGFSLGGATALSYAFQSPRRYVSVGSYDAVLLDWEEDNRQVDPQTTSDVTFQDFPYIYGNNPDREWFESINPLNLIATQTVPFLLFMAASNENGPQANAPKVKRFQEIMARRGITNYASSPILSEESGHEWYWVDEYLYRSLPFHTHALNAG